MLNLLIIFSYEKFFNLSGLSSLETKQFITKLKGFVIQKNFLPKIRIYKLNETGYKPLQKVLTYFERNKRNLP